VAVRDHEPENDRRGQQADRKALAHVGYIIPPAALIAPPR
jgi:hypothetical protein